MNEEKDEKHHKSLQTPVPQSPSSSRKQQPYGSPRYRDAQRHSQSPSTPSTSTSSLSVPHLHHRYELLKSRYNSLQASTTFQQQQYEQQQRQHEQLQQLYKKLQQQHSQHQAAFSQLQQQYSSAIQLQEQLLLREEQHKEAYRQLNQQYAEGQGEVQRLSSEVESLTAALKEEKQRRLSITAKHHQREQQQIEEQREMRELMQRWKDEINEKDQQHLQTLQEMQTLKDQLQIYSEQHQSQKPPAHTPAPLGISPLPLSPLATIATPPPSIKPRVSHPLFTPTSAAEYHQAEDTGDTSAIVKSPIAASTAAATAADVAVVSLSVATSSPSPSGKSAVAQSSPSISSVSTCSSSSAVSVLDLDEFPPLTLSKKPSTPTTTGKKAKLKKKKRNNLTHSSSYSSTGLDQSSHSRQDAGFNSSDRSDVERAVDAVNDKAAAAPFPIARSLIYEYEHGNDRAASTPQLQPLSPSSPATAATDEAAFIEQSELQRQQQYIRELETGTPGGEVTYDSRPPSTAEVMDFSAMVSATPPSAAAAAALLTSPSSVLQRESRLVQKWTAEIQQAISRERQSVGGEGEDGGGEEDVSVNVSSSSALSSPLSPPYTPLLKLSASSAFAGSPSSSLLLSSLSVLQSQLQSKDRALQSVYQYVHQLEDKNKELTEAAELLENSVDTKTCQLQQVQEQVLTMSQELQKTASESKIHRASHEDRDAIIVAIRKEEEKFQKAQHLQQKLLLEQQVKELQHQVEELEHQTRTQIFSKQQLQQLYISTLRQLTDCLDHQEAETTIAPSATPANAEGDPVMQSFSTLYSELLTFVGDSKRASSNHLHLQQYYRERIEQMLEQLKQQAPVPPSPLADIDGQDVVIGALHSLHEQIIRHLTAQKQQQQQQQQERDDWKQLVDLMIVQRHQYLDIIRLIPTSDSPSQSLPAHTTPSINGHDDNQHQALVSSLQTLSVDVAGYRMQVESSQQRLSELSKELAAEKELVTKGFYQHQQLKKQSEQYLEAIQHLSEECSNHLNLAQDPSYLSHNGDDEVMAALSALHTAMITVVTQQEQASKHRLQELQRSQAEESQSAQQHYDQSLRQLQQSHTAQQQYYLQLIKGVKSRLQSDHERQRDHTPDDHSSDTIVVEVMQLQESLLHLRQHHQEQIDSLQSQHQQQQQQLQQQLSQQQQAHEQLQQRHQQQLELQQQEHQQQQTATLHHLSTLLEHHQQEQQQREAEYQQQHSHQQQQLHQQHQHYLQTLAKLNEKFHVESGLSLVSEAVVEADEDTRLSISCLCSAFDDELLQLQSQLSLWEPSAAEINASIDLTTSHHVE